MTLDIWNAQDAYQYNLGGARVEITSAHPGQFEHQIYHPKNHQEYDKLPIGTFFKFPSGILIYQKHPPHRGIKI